MADIVELIKVQHRQVETLLEQAQQAEPEEISALLRQVAELLKPHSEAEASFVYRAIQDYDQSEAGEVEDGLAEHHHIDELLEELLAANPSSPGFDGKFTAMVAEIRHHVEEEEQDLLPVLLEQASDEERQELGARFAEVTGQELEDVVEQGEAEPDKSTQRRKPAAKQDKSQGKSTQRAKPAAKQDKPERGKGAGSAEDSAGSGQSREELYQKAKEKGVSGRSSMSKEELARALDEK